MATGELVERRGQWVVERQGWVSKGGGLGKRWGARCWGEEAIAWCEGCSQGFASEAFWQVGKAELGKKRLRSKRAAGRRMVVIAGEVEGGGEQGVPVLGSH